MTVKAKRARVDLTVAQKQEICRYYEKNPTKTIKNLQDYFSDYYGLRIGNSTIGNIVKRAEHWSSIEFPENVKRTTSGKFANMEKDLFEWICKMEKPVTEKEVHMKAAELTKKRSLVDQWNAFRDRGWITSFKRRYNLILVPLESQDDEFEVKKGYRPGKMPNKREPIHRVTPLKGRRAGVSKYFKSEKPDGANTSSIIYDAAIENILQDVHCDDDDDDDDDNVVSPRRATSSTYATKMETRSSPRTASRVSNANADTNIIHKAAIENILSDTENPQDNHNAVSSTATEVFPVVIQTTQSSVSVPSVASSEAHKAMTTLKSYFEQNPSSSREDFGHLQAVDAKLKWLSAKEALNNLRTYMSADPTRNHDDIQYLNNLDQRL